MNLSVFFLCVLFSLLHSVMAAAFSDSGSWLSPFSSPPGWLLPPGGTCSQPHEPDTLGVGELRNRLQTYSLEGSGNHHRLFLFVGWRDPVKHFEVAKRLGHA